MKVIHNETFVRSKHRAKKIAVADWDLTSEPMSTWYIEYSSGTFGHGPCSYAAHRGIRHSGSCKRTAHKVGNGSIFVGAMHQGGWRQFME